MTSETDAEIIQHVRLMDTPTNADPRRRYTEAQLEMAIRLARRGAAMQWRAIETAPKDGTPLLLLWPDAAEKMAVMWWDEYYKNWLGYYDGINPGYQLPTHWMPLPPPPQEKP